MLLSFVYLPTNTLGPTIQCWIACELQHMTGKGGQITGIPGTEPSYIHPNKRHVQRFNEI
jgi:hypothetical protein